MPRKKTEKKTDTSTRKTPKSRLKVNAENKPKALKDSKPREKKVQSLPKAASSQQKKTMAAPEEASGPQPVKKPGRPSRLPRYGQTQLVAFVRDPNCIFTYWEVTPETVEDVRRQLMHEYEGSSMVLRVLKSKQDGTAELLEEITVNRGEMNRYVNLEEAGEATYWKSARRPPRAVTWFWRAPTRSTRGPRRPR